VVGVNFHGGYLAVGRRATLADVVQHVRHLVNVGGLEHVAVGSDFEGGILAPVGLEDVRGFPRLAAALATAGFSRADVERVFAGNALRVLGAAAP
jgi:membrane dipeptidase